LVAVRAPNRRLGRRSIGPTVFTNYVDVLALSLVSIVPVIVLFLIVRRRLLDSIMVSGGAISG
jgi:ABC-type glycerol-3-phosphate transport system permease component